MAFRRFRHALSGLGVALLRPEILGHVLVALLVALLGLALCLSRTAWALVALATGLVLVTETLNTALEDVVDAVSRRRNARLRRVKDVAAAAVLTAAGTAAVIGFLVFLPPLLHGALGRCLLPLLWAL